MKDSGDAIFGVYMGDGVRQSKGKGYYGSGESYVHPNSLSLFHLTVPLAFFGVMSMEIFKFTNGRERTNT